MKIIYRGGYNKLDPKSVKNSTLYVYQKAILNFINKKKNVAIVTLAKPDDFYDEMIRELNLDRVEVINYKSDNVDWSKYDLIIILGGNTHELYDKLVSQNFDIKLLKEDVIIIGDSAGAYVLGTSVLIQDPDSDLQAIPGFCPESNLFVIAHCNNPKYCNDNILTFIENSAKKQNIEVLKLNENEEKLLDENGKLNPTDKNREEMENL
ncbi:Type 1 glutamine amidotransferase-like domain-containing protein [Patescibacteria group bacterium]